MPKICAPGGKLRTGSRAGWAPHRPVHMRAALSEMWRRALLGAYANFFGFLGSRPPNLHDAVDVQ